MTERQRDLNTRWGDTADLGCLLDVRQPLRWAVVAKAAAYSELHRHSTGTGMLVLHENPRFIAAQVS